MESAKHRLPQGKTILRIPLMPQFPVSEAKQRELANKMRQWGISEEDLVEEFIRGSGPGGQKIQKTSVVVTLFHPPSGIRVRCHEGRSQGLNRYYARKRLVEKLEEKTLGIKSELRQKMEKIRRQKRKRSRRAKEKILTEKRRRAAVKKLRKTPAEEKD